MTTAQDPSNQAPTFIIRGQYIKDLSFENPNAPRSLMSLDKAPQIDVNVDLRAQKIDQDLYEMTLHLTARATLDGMALFLADLAYAGIFQLFNIPPERVEPIVMIECPFVLFPFARRVMADITRDGGFPPIMLDPIDFHSLYAQKRTSQA